MNDDLPVPPEHPTLVPVGGKEVPDPHPASPDHSLKQALETSGDGIWEWDIRTGMQTFSRRWKEMLGYAEDEIGTGYPEFFSRVHPEDRERLALNNTAYLKAPLQKNAIELRMRCKDGSWKWILSRVLVVHLDDSGHPAYITGMHTDISDRKQKEAELLALNQQLREQAAILETTLTSINQGIVMVDAADLIIAYNPRVNELLNLPDTLLATHPCLHALGQFQLDRGDFGPQACFAEPHARRYLLSGCSGAPPLHYLRQTPAGRTLEIQTRTLPNGGMVRTFSDVTNYVQTEAAHRRLDQLLQSIQSMAKVGGMETNVRDQRVTWSDGIFAILDTTRQDFTPTLAGQRQFLTPATAAAIHPYTTDFSGAPAAHDLELELITATGRRIWVHSQGTSTWDQGRFVTCVSVIQDITERREAEQAFREHEARWKLALESTGDGLWDWNIQTGEEYLSPQLKLMYGFDEGDRFDHHQDLDSRTHPDDLEQLARDRRAHLEGDSPTYVNEHRILCKDGHWKWVLSRGMVISRDAQGHPLRMIGTHTDISARKATEALVWQQAHFDPLTGLPNRRMLRHRLEQEIRRNRRDARKLAILFIDLDHFKEVNDTLGHDSGDMLLMEAARRIQACVRDSDTVARMGGDEFTVILTELSDAKCVERTLQSILQALASVFALGHERVYVSASIGISVYPLDGKEVEDLFKSADQALYVAKGGGRNRFSFYTPALQEAAQNRARLAHDLRSGLSEQQFSLVFQPIVGLASGEIHKAEALIRWHHPSRGLVSPAEFIPIAETSGLIVEIGNWVLSESLRQVEVWRRTLSPRFQISVNKSPVQFQAYGPNQQPWHEQVAAAGLPGDCLVVEITEGLLLETSASVIDKLLNLRDAGIGVSLDDFGTGYSSLSYLQKFDIDFIKIDQSFVRHLIPASTELALCKAIIVMAHELGIQVVAEGVETALQRDLLLQAGCDYAQGYFFAHPMSAPDFEAFITAR